jgi:hypothetical protein
MRGKTKLALHPLDNRHQRYDALISISFAEPDTFDYPVYSRLRCLPPHNNARESFKSGISFPNGFGNRRFQLLPRDRRAPIIIKFFPEPSQNTLHREMEDDLRRRAHRTELKPNCRISFRNRILTGSPTSCDDPLR